MINIESSIYNVALNSKEVHTKSNKAGIILPPINQKRTN